MYVDFDYYVGIYGGSLVTYSDFTKYELNARIVMNNYTLKEKLTIKLLEGSKYVDNIKMAVCSIIDIIKWSEDLLEKSLEANSMFAEGISSETVKSHSVTLNVSDGFKSNQVNRQVEVAQVDVMKRYLLSTGLLYRGL